jgi:hypothetical protein
LSLVAVLASGRDVCNDIRMQDGVMLYKRDNGEVVKFVPR